MRKNATGFDQSLIISSHHSLAAADNSSTHKMKKICRSIDLSPLSFDFVIFFRFVIPLSLSHIILVQLSFVKRSNSFHNPSSPQPFVWFGEEEVWLVWFGLVWFLRMLLCVGRPLKIMVVFAIVRCRSSRARPAVDHIR